MEYPTLPFFNQPVRIVNAMCLLFVAIAPRPDIRLALVANRDEFYARPTDAARFRPDHPDLLAGWDLLAGGTWLGVTRDGRLAALTNVRDPSRKRDHPASRGVLVRDFLLGDEPGSEFCTRAISTGSEMLGFNLLVGHIGPAFELFWCSNTSNRIQRLEPGLYGLSNAQLDTAWPKVEQGKARVSASLNRHAFGPALMAALNDVMRDSCPAADQALPNTGVPKPWEKALSPMFIATPDYGTRSTTVLLVHSDGRALFREVTHLHDAPEHSAVDFEFVLPLAAR